jgi:hypothetical protein
VALNLRALPEGSVEPEVQALEWGGEVAHLAPPFDLVVCSDLVFCAHNAGCLPALLHAILTLSEVWRVSCRVVSCRVVSCRL